MGFSTWWFSKLNKTWAVEFKDVYIGIPVSWFICYLIFWYPFFHSTDVLSAIAKTFLPVILIIKCHVSSRCIILDFVLILYVTYTWISLLGKLFRLFICFCELVVLWEVQVLHAGNLGLA
ncbi:hypothetical protein NE237_027363 [Protea cynaroides]|uniref:Uncharacterized protein n=1 Tax=Protea cynaroides TaxID=273540 RepID=A0A9Q0GP74_9MAGN|nr:hypothetical protein NE237_027363 [Protea cynaroides]